MSVKYRKWHLGGGPVTLKPLNQFIKLSTGIKIGRGSAFACCWIEQVKSE